MAITECGKGHIYDSDQYAACPYCNSGAGRIDFVSGWQDVDSGRTVAPGMAVPPAPPAVGGALYEPGPTVAPESYRRKKREENKTVGVFKETYGLDPIVGWLVCIEGPEKGRDYRLWARINTIGRSKNMDVCIQADKTITNENHARLAYDPRNNKFQLIPGESTNNIYINGEPVYTPLPLTAYDMIEIGISKMLFVPFCCDRFQWAEPGAEA